MSDISPAADSVPLNPGLAPPPADASTLASLAPPLQAAQPNTASTQRNLRVATRIWCAFIFAMSIGMLGLGLFLHPDPSGVETHKQLHLPPCGFYFTTGLPCPTCGCTTAVSHFAHGQFVASFLTQPFGFAVALLALLALPLAGVGIVTGRWLGPSLFTLNWYWQTWLYGSLGLLVLAWIYKIILVKSGHPLL